MKKALLLAAVLASLTTPTDAATRQHWATLDGVVKVQKNGTVLQNPSVEDRLKIQELFALWGLAFDEGEPDVIGSLFTEDGTLTILEGSRTPLVSNTGRKDIVASVTSAFQQQGDQRRHAISNVVITTMTQDHASATAYGIVTAVEGDHLLLNASVIYAADLTKGPDSVWRFTTLKVGMDTYIGKHPVEKD